MTDLPTRPQPEGGGAGDRRRSRSPGDPSPRPLLAPLPPQLVDPRFAIDDPLILPATQKTRPDNLRTSHRDDLQSLVQLPSRPLLREGNLDPDPCLSRRKSFGKLDLKLSALGDSCLQID